MGKQWRTRYPLSEPVVRMLRWARWSYVGFSLLVIVTFILTLVEDGTSWELWADGVGLIVFPGFFFLTSHLLRRNAEFLQQRHAGPS
ncbi:hypothetical protein [Streptomyces sp. NBC_01198]|uniref:hypothetical protein n=1 Tax=Streptomyces sp. NBC_01198 TaxID=2903769 RepID=UPI002E10DF1E|nr:hypothetical protein OG702_00440 [Streptomyces sp. NBC_01198]